MSKGTSKRRSQVDTVLAELLSCTEHTAFSNQGEVEYARSLEYRAHDTITALRAKLIAAEAERDKLRRALRNLSCDVEGLKAFEAEVRHCIGNTNWNVLMEFNDKARAALKEGQ